MSTEATAIGTEAPGRLWMELVYERVTTVDHKPA
jgi:hypothetical protein